MILRLPIPSEADGPDGCLAVPGGDHDLPNPGCAAEVERVDAATCVPGPGSETERLDENGIEVGGGAGGVEALEEEALVDGGVAPVLGGGERGGEDDGVGVGGPHGAGGLLQEPSIANGIDQAVSPVGGNVGLIPNLIEADCVLVAAGKGGGESGKGFGLGGGRQPPRPVVCGVGLRGDVSAIPGPGGAPVQNDDRRKPSGGDFGQDLVGPRPLELAWSGFDAGPVDAEARPSETGVLQAVQGVLPGERVVVLFERDGNAEKGYLAGWGGQRLGIDRRQQAGGGRLAEMAQRQGNFHTQVADDGVEAGELDQSNAGQRHGIGVQEPSWQWSRMFWMWRLSSSNVDRRFCAALTSMARPCSRSSAAC